MPSIQKIVISLAFAATVLGQASQAPDGQVVAASFTPIKQISDGQPQAATSAPSVTIAPSVTPAPSAPVKQIGDGQIQAATSTVTPVKQIGDGQIQAGTHASTGVVPVPTNGTIASNKPSASAFAGSANMLGWSQEVAIAAIGAAAGFAML